MPDENEWCSYMQRKCTSDCKWAYENRHGSDGYTCMRPNTEYEDIITKLYRVKHQLEDQLFELERQIKRLEGE